MSTHSDTTSPSRPVRQNARELIISEQQAGQRIDNFLVKHLKGIPRSHIYRLLRSGQVRVNSGRKKAHYKLQAGDRLRIPPVRVNDDADADIPPGLLQRLENSIIYEDENLLALNKPSGIAVHKGSGLRFGVIEALRQIRPQETLELVHRLDRDTSGCLLLAKNRDSLAELHALLRQEKSIHIEKTYLALVAGRWRGGDRTVDAPLSKIKRGGEHMVEVDKNGDRAISHFHPLEVFEHNDLDCSLMQIRIETGRTHQIRVHALSCGHPLAGDSKYGDKVANRQFREAGLKRLFLHAQSLYLPLDTPISIEAPLSDELTAFLDNLKT
ncbi:MAG TPA: RluA family pseudouridine synthase [Gammaproteobacteria bacterium]|nr:RluA family pseudouridine synthase [Gammaproteobacteria bacterium]